MVAVSNGFRGGHNRLAGPELRDSQGGRRALGIAEPLYVLHLIQLRWLPWTVLQVRLRRNASWRGVEHLIFTAMSRR